MKSKKVNNYGITIETIRTMKKQLMAVPPLKFPETHFMDIFVKDRGWFRVTNFAVFEITETHDELSFRILSGGEEDEILNAIDAQFAKVKK